MGVAEYWSVDGGALTLEGDGVERWPPGRSAIAARAGGTLAVMESGGLASLRMLLEQFDGMREVESYEQADGPVSLLRGELYDVDDFAYRGDQHALLWERDPVGLVVKAEGRSRRWFTEFAGLVRVEANDRAVRASPAEPADWSFEALPTPGLRLLVTIPEVGVARLRTGDEARQALRSDRTRQVPAGTLHAFDGERQDRLVLATPAARLEVTLLDSSVQGASDALSSLRSLRWRP